MALLPVKVKAAEADPGLKLKETETKNVYEVIVENWDSEACGVEVRFTTDQKIAEYLYTPLTESESTFNLARTEENGEQTTFYIYLSRLSPISAQDQVTLGTLDFGKSGKPKLVEGSGYVKTVGADYAQSMWDRGQITVNSKPDSGDHTGDGGNSENPGNTGENGSNGNQNNNNGNGGNNNNSNDQNGNGSADNNNNGGDNHNDDKGGNDGKGSDSVNKGTGGNGQKSTGSRSATAVSKKNSSPEQTQDDTVLASGTTGSSEPAQKNDDQEKKEENKDKAEISEQPSEEASQVPTTAPQEQDKGSGSSLVLLIVIIVLVVAAVGIGVFVFMRTKKK